MNELVKYYSKNNLITSRKLKEISGYYRLNRQELLDRYNQAFLALFRKAYTSSGFYKELYQQHGIGIEDIKDLSDITRLPVIDRHMIKERVDDIYTGLSFLKVKGLTSGTTGSPLTVYRTPFDIATEQAYVRHYRERLGYRFGEPLVSIRGALGKTVTHEYYKRANILYLSSPNINEGTIDFYYKLVKEFKPRAIEAFPSYLTKFSNELDRKGLQLEIPVAFTSSEMLYRHQRDRIEPFLKTQIHDWYGNVERTIALGQDENNEYYPMPLYSLNEFEPGRVVTTGLINTRFPMIRYVVKDLISVEGNDLLENFISPKIIRIEGRVGDYIDLKDGSVVGCIDHAFKGISHLETAQVHQYSVNEPINVKLVVTPAFGKADEDQLRANLTRMLGTDIDIRFIYCGREDLTYLAHNKFSLIIKKKPTRTN